jgi:hypothetical protein
LSDITLHVNFGRTDQVHRGELVAEVLPDRQSVEQFSKNGEKTPLATGLALVHSPCGIFQMYRTDSVCPAAIRVINLPSDVFEWRPLGRLTRWARVPLGCQAQSGWQPLERVSKNGGCTPLVTGLTLAHSPGGIFQVYRADSVCPVAIRVINLASDIFEWRPLGRVTRWARVPLDCQTQSG